MSRLPQKISLLLLSASLSFPALSLAQSVKTYNAAELTPHSEISITPRTGTFVEGSTFEVPILLNTKKLSINAVDLTITFDPKVLSIIQPSGGRSIIGLWVQPPSFDNTKGTASIAGVIPGGIASDSGLVVSITFKAKAPGTSEVRIDDSSHILLNNGVGSETVIDANRGVYTVIPKPPSGVTVLSDSHPFQDRWYNNNNVTLQWNKDPGVSGFSLVLDNKPNTVPDNTITTTDTSETYEAVADGISYFHVKAIKQGVWGATTDYVIRIDTAPPAAFAPTVGYLSAAVINRFLVSYFTTDSLSGMDYYEVGVIDKASPTSQTPIFTESDSPYQLPATTETARVIVRAFDKAGNVREGSVDVNPPFFLRDFAKAHLVSILLIILALIVIYSIIHYLFGHQIIRRVRRVVELLRRESGRRP